MSQGLKALEHMTQAQGLTTLECMTQAQGLTALDSPGNNKIEASWQQMKEEERKAK